MNNRGWGLRAELWICLCLVVAFVIAVVLIQRIVNQINYSVTTEESSNYPSNSTGNITVNYTNLEDELVIGAKKYINKYYSNRDLEAKLTITVVRLKIEEMIDKLSVNGIECSGYVEMQNSSSEVKYYPYIRCGNLYQTNGYNEEHDNLDL